MRLLHRTSHEESIKNVCLVSGLGIIVSLSIGGILFWFTSLMGMIEQTAKLQEIISSFFATILNTTLIVWMTEHGSDKVRDVEKNAEKNLSAGISDS
jgi:Iron permease FTR1 family.